MATVLLVVIYTAYIGLGIPDSLFGTAWPAIYAELELPISYANAVTVLTCFGTITSSLLSARIIAKLGTALVTAFSTTLTALALLGLSFSGNFLFICLFSVPLGFGAGAIDCAQNNYVAIHYNARQMSFLHCFYGVGVSLSPFLISVGIDKSGWRQGYIYAFTVQALISTVCIIAIPLWKKAHPPVKDSGGDTEKPIAVPITRLARDTKVLLTWCMFIFSCGIESICTAWGSTYLVESVGLTPAVAARSVTLYFVGLATGRFVSGLLSGKLAPWRLIHIGSSILFFAIMLIALPLNAPALKCLFLFLTGFGVGPIYPNLTYLTPIHFGKEKSAAVIGSQMAMTYVGILVIPIVFGFVAQRLSAAIFPYFNMTLFAIFFISMIMLMKKVKTSAVCDEEQ